RPLNGGLRGPPSGRPVSPLTPRSRGWGHHPMGDVLQRDDHFVCKPLSKPLKTSTLMHRSHATVHDLLSGPPPEVLAEVDAAWERAQDLFADELELSFDLDKLTRRVTG